MVEAGIPQIITVRSSSGALEQSNVQGLPKLSSMSPDALGLSS